MITPQKNTRTKALLLAYLIVLGMIVSPVLANSYEITAEPLGGELHGSLGKFSSYTVDGTGKDLAIQRISVDVPTGATVNYTLWYGNGQTVSGWMIYRNSTDCVDLLSFYDGWCQYSGVAISTDVQGYSYRGAQEFGRVDIVGYGRNWTTSTTYDTGFIIYDSVFGVSERRIMAFYPVTSLSDNIIYKFRIDATKPVAIGWYTNTRANVGKAATTTVLEATNEWITMVLSWVSTIKEFAIQTFYWLKFFLWDNLVLTIVLYIGITGAVAFNQSKDIFAALKKFFGYQRGLYNFILSMWQALIDIVATFRGIFRI